MPKVTIGIPVYNRGASLVDLLRNLRQRTTADVDHEIVVVDDSGKDWHRKIVREACSKYGARFIAHEGNRGVAAGWNTIVRSDVSSDFIVILNDDVFVANDWLRYMAYALEMNPKVGSFGMNCRFISKEDAREIVKGPDAKVIPLNVHWRGTELIRNERFRSMPPEEDGAPGRVMCLPPGQEVVTDRGLVAIEDVRVGDRVFSHKGRWRKVWKTIRNEYEGLLYKIIPSRVNLPFTVTEDHPLLVAAGKKCNYHGGYCTPKKAILCKEHSDDRLPTEGWVAPRDLEDGAFLKLPRFTSTTQRVRLDLASGVQLPSPSRWVIGRKSLSLAGANAKTVPRFVNITPDLLRFFGLFISEGSTDLSNGGTISFSFHENEVELRDFVRKVAKEVFGLVSRVHHDRGDHSASVILNALPLALWLRGTFGECANKKRIPWWMMDLPPFLQLFLVEAMMDGDGTSSVDKSGFSRQHYDTVSPVLAWQFFQMLCRQNILCTFSKTSRKATCERWQDIYHFTMTENPQGGFMDEGYIYLPIRERTASPYRGPVYNLEVEEDESYCVPASAVHNCPTGCFFGFRREIYDLVGGFDERYFAFYEETDFGVACAREGYPSFSLGVPDHNYHMWSASFGSAPEIDAGGIMARSREAFVRKWTEILGVKFADAPEIHSLLMDKILPMRIRWLGQGRTERSEIL